MIKLEMLNNMTKAELERLAVAKAQMTRTAAKKLPKAKLLKILTPLTEEAKMKPGTDATDTNFDFDASAVTTVDVAATSAINEEPTEKGPRMRSTDPLSVALRAVNEFRSEDHARWTAGKGVGSDLQEQLDWFVERFPKFSAMAFTLRGKENAGTIHVVGCEEAIVGNLIDLLLSKLPSGVDQPHIEQHLLETPVSEVAEAS